MHAFLPEKQQQQPPPVIDLTQYIYSCVSEPIYGSNSGSGKADLQTMYDFLSQWCVELLFMNKLDSYVVLN